MRKLTRCNQHFRKASERLPLGVASNFRYWGPDLTLYIERAKGARLWDLDGNEYIDYRMGYGPCILGYADERVDEAARAGMDVGGVFALSTVAEYAVADRISKMVSSAEMVRFSNSGTEAVMSALRLARAYTEKDSYIVIEGGYHGIFDSMLWYSAVEEWRPGQVMPSLLPYSRGVPEILRQLIYMVPLNDADALEDVLAEYGDNIGAFVVEPIMGNCCAITASKEYLQAAREICDRHGVIMIIDEVKTGFRVARGGVQELFGVQADLCTFAKAMANGYPISALAGQKRIMESIGDGVAHGGTFTAHSVSLAAAERTLEILDETDALESIAHYGLRLRAGLGEILDRHGIPHSFTGHPALSGLFFKETPPTNYRDWKTADYTLYDSLAPVLHDHGILCEPDSREPWFLCEAHDEICLDETLNAFEDALKITLENLTKSQSKIIETC